MRLASLLQLFALTGMFWLGTAPLQAARDGDFVFISAVDVNTLDPQKMSWNHDIRTAQCLWEPLVLVKLPEMTMEPGAAESWQISQDGLTYTFHLRPEGRWSNGQPVTSRDFLYAWRRALLADFAADYAQLFFVIQGAEDFFKHRAQRLEALAAQRSDLSSQQALEADLRRFEQTVGLSTPDERTLVVKLNQPTPYFLELCAFATFMPNHAQSLERIISLDPDTGMLRIPPGYWTDPAKLVTNGPYRLERYRFKRDLLVSANPHYWNQPAMGNRSILQRIVENPQTALLLYDRREADWLPDLPTASPIAADLVNSGRRDVHAVPWAGTYFYSFNCEAKLADGSANPLADARVRRALSLAMDRQRLVEQVTRLRQPVARSFVPPGMIPGYEPPVEDGAEFDPREARRLLAEAGYDDPAKLTGLSILYNTGGGHEPAAQAIKRMWQEHLGVIVALESMEVRSFRQRLKRQQYTIARASWIGDYRDPTTFLDKYHSQGGNNDAHWASDGYDQLLAQASRELDPARRMAQLRQAEQLLLGDAPIAPIYHYITLHVYDPQRVINLHPNSWNFRRLERVRVQR